jgi:hypothetical protein
MTFKWIFKAIVQKSISILPNSDKINFLFQKYITKGVTLNEPYFDDRIIHARNHIDSYRRLTNNPFPEKTLELGSGWYPVVPLYMYLSGCKEINSIDITKLINRERILLTIKMFLRYIQTNRLNAKADVFLPDRIESLTGILSGNISTEKELVEHLKFNYIIGDSRKTIFTDNYFDLIHSNNTFEHIDPLILKDILKEFFRIQKEASVLSHFIDLSDHFAHYDKDITIYNFLKFSDFKWKIIDNSIQPQNRMRLTDYKALYDSLGIKYEIIELREGDVNTLKSNKINKKFKDYSLNELAVSHCQFISTKKTY